ncbi:MAG TPA: LptA/OstA family protein, partial [Pyrinomonadaceae bacterium]|nr:LptA/OstA family protein [Pyrinomonadaceae bacterium]
MKFSSLAPRTVQTDAAAFVRAVFLCAPLLLLLLSLAHAPARAQQTNPVDRKVTNPITDTPNVNPLSTDPPVVRSRRPAQTPQPGDDATPAGQQPTDRVDVRARTQVFSGPEDARVATYEGDVDVRIGIYRLQADKVTVYEATNRVLAEGNVVFDQGEAQRITGTRADWNYATKLGFFVESTGFTNQTQDGTIIYFTA